MARFAELFRQYEAALNRGDVASIVDCYADRFLHLTRHADGWLHDWRRNDAEFRAMLERAARWYEGIGARRFAVFSVNESQLHPSHSLARLNWGVFDRSGVEIVSFGVTFMVRVRQARGAIVGLVAHNERRRIEERGISAASADLFFDLPGPEFNAVSGVRPALDGVRPTGTR